MIRGNHIGGYANASAGFGIYASGCGAMGIMHNEIFTNRVGIKLYIPVTIIVANNLIQANINQGMIIQNDTAGNFEKVMVTGNRIHDNSSGSTGGFSGIHVSVSGAGLLNNCTFVGNTINDSSVASKKQQYGIDVTGATASTNFTNSVIANNGLHGNLTGAINMTNIAASNVVFGNTGDTTIYRFNDFAEDRIVSAPADPAAGFARRYAKVIDANNDGLFVKRKINGAVIEVML
jgi:hypothetical protein